ncbi:HEPN domain-containing protein [Pseudoalteromonas aliena]|uniref:HEPN domain-containing protein n=1 Tax=Pseudoalteromonas aliena TaxID=247523 RepID=UPI0024956568|nr:HEPN domain-containing protein [Pseudoalteromonas aliena]
MATPTRHQGHDKYKTRIKHLFDLYSENPNTETQAEDAKYLAVLISGYLEQAIKEVLLEYSSSISAPNISKYIKDSWPTSRNMNVQNIGNILKQFNDEWEVKFFDWLLASNEQNNCKQGGVKRKGIKKSDRRSDVNTIVSWRNFIAHGQESKTTNVTLVSVKEKFITVKELVVFIEGLVKS